MEFVQEFVEETVDFWMSFCVSFFPFLDGEAGVGKESCLNDSQSVKDLQKDFCEGFFGGSRDSCSLESGAKARVCIVEKLEVSGGFL